MKPSSCPNNRDHLSAAVRGSATPRRFGCRSARKASTNPGGFGAPRQPGCVSRCAAAGAPGPEPGERESGRPRSARHTGRRLVRFRSRAIPARGGEPRPVAVESTTAPRRPGSSPRRLNADDRRRAPAPDDDRPAPRAARTAPGRRDRNGSDDFRSMTNPGGPCCRAAICRAVGAPPVRGALVQHPALPRTSPRRTASTSPGCTISAQAASPGAAPQYAHVVVMVGARIVAPVSDARHGSGGGGRRHCHRERLCHDQAVGVQRLHGDRHRPRQHPALRYGAGRATFSPPRPRRRVLSHPP